MRPFPIAITVSSAALLGLAVWGCFGLNHHLIVALDKWGDAAPDLNPTLDAIIGPRGTLHEINKATVKIGDAIVTTQLQERTAAPHVTAAMDQFGAAAVHLSETADALSKTAQAGTGTLQAATDTLGEGKRTIAAAQPLLVSYTRAGDDLDALLKRKAIGDVLDNLAGATGQGNAILGDFRQVADKARADYLRPVPWWQQPIKKSSDLLDIGAAIARHTP